MPYAGLLRIYAGSLRIEASAHKSEEHRPGKRKMEERGEKRKMEEREQVAPAEVSVVSQQKTTCSFAWWLMTGADLF
jgi:hypothetical protein